MTKEELAALLNNREYCKEITCAEARSAKADLLVAIFGASDDLLVFQGSINDEIGAYNGTSCQITGNGIIIQQETEQAECAMVQCRYFQDWLARQRTATIRAEWCPDGFDGSWRIGADIPHATFDIHEDDGLYCRGIVIDLKELQK